MNSRGATQRSTPLSDTNSSRTCGYCGGPIKKTADPRTKYCSPKCGGLSRRTHDHAPIRQCDHCGESFTVKEPRRRNRFCSVRCGSAHQWIERRKNLPPKRTKPCKWCGEDYEYQYRSNRVSNFCSIKCSNDWKAANVEEVYPLGKDHYNWRGGVSQHNRGPNWFRQRKKALKRDGHQCQDCGKHEAELDLSLDVHHIIPFFMFGEERYKEANELTNLVALCRGCHMRLERTSDLQRPLWY